MTPREMVLAVDGYLRGRAWLAWHTGLVTNGAIRSLGELMPKGGGPVSDEVAQAKNIHAFLMWHAACGGIESEAG